MRKYGRIVICADSVEEAEKELNMIKDLLKIGAESGSGSAKSGMAEATLGPRVEMIRRYPDSLPNDLMTRAMANAYATRGQGEEYPDSDLITRMLMSSDDEIEINIGEIVADLMGL